MSDTNMDGLSDYKKYLFYQNKRKEEFKAMPKPFRARKMYFADGTEGMVPVGRIRSFRRFGRYPRRRYGGYRRRRLYGHGGFWGDLWGGIKNVGKGVLSSIPKGTFAKIGSRFGPIGGLLGQGLSSVSGYGAYEKDMTGPNERMVQEVPLISNDTSTGEDGSIRIRHKEYVADIYSTGSTFHMALNLALNIGLESTFPWLSTLANSFTQYRISGLIFHYKSTSGNLSTTQALGEIIMSVNYNPAANAFTTKQQMLNEVFSVSKVPSMDAEIPIECNPNQTPMSKMWIRNGALPTGGQLQFYDVGTLQIATQGQSVAVTLGELWVTYEIELFKPQLPVVNISGSGEAPSAYYVSTTYTNSLPLKAAKASYDSIGLTLSDAGVITFPANYSGQILIVISWYGSSTALTAPSFTASAGLTGLTIVNGGSNINSTGTSASFIWVFAGQILDQGSAAGTAQTITVGTAGTLPASGTNCSVIVTNLSGAT